MASARDAVSLETISSTEDGSPRPRPGGAAPRPFPATAYRGFVGQPINCLACDAALFAEQGCQHIAASRAVPSELVSRLRCDPGVMLNLGKFL